MYDDAVQHASKALDINPSYYKAFVHRAAVYNSKEMYEEAARDFEVFNCFF
jgi:Tfp pilus assembly protein PilF